MGEYNNLQAYIKHLYSTNEIKAKLYSISHKKDTIVSRFENLNLITDLSKKLPIISEQCVFWENIANRMDLNSLNISRSSEPLSSRITIYQEVEFQTMDLKRVEEWFELSKEMLRSGKIIYVPNIQVRNTTVAEDENGVVEPAEFHKREDHDYLNTQEYFQATPDAGVFVNNRDVIPLFNFDIPGFEGISPSQLCKIMGDHPEELHRFKNFIQRKLLDFKGTLGSESFSAEIRRVRLDIDDELVKLKEDYKTLSRTTAIDMLGAQAITWTLHVLVFMQHPNELLKLVLPGGALAALSGAFAKYLKDRMRLGNDQLEFLLVVSKEAKEL